MLIDDFFCIVCDEMLLFLECELVLFFRLYWKYVNISDKRMWIVGGKDVNLDVVEFMLVKNGSFRRMFINVGIKLNGGVVGDFLGFDMNNIGLVEVKLIFNFVSVVYLLFNWEKGFNWFFFKLDGVFYEDGQFQVGVWFEYCGQMVCLILYFINKILVFVGLFIMMFDLDMLEKINLIWDVKGFFDMMIVWGVQVQQVIMFEVKKVFEKSLIIWISYLVGVLQVFIFKFFVIFYKFMDFVELIVEDFFKRWK